MSYRCKNRITKQVIQRHDFTMVREQVKFPVHVRQLECLGHGSKSPIYGYGSKTWCNFNQSHPWEWCSECHKIYDKLREEAHRKLFKINLNRYMLD
jgi:hypothetical protein